MLVSYTNMFVYDTNMFVYDTNMFVYDTNMFVSYTNMFVYCTYPVNICKYFLQDTRKYISQYLTKIRTQYVQTGSPKFLSTFLEFSLQNAKKFKYIEDIYYYRTIMNFIQALKIYNKDNSNR